MSGIVNSTILSNHSTHALCHLLFATQDLTKIVEDSIDVLIESLGNKEHKVSGKKIKDLKLVLKQKREMLKSLLLALDKDTTEEL